MAKDWQVHGRAIKVLTTPDAPAFDRKIVTFAASLVWKEIRKMRRSKGPMTRVELARRLEVSRNRVPRLLEVLGVEFPEDNEQEGNKR